MRWTAVIAKWKWLKWLKINKHFACAQRLIIGFILTKRFQNEHLMYAYCWRNSTIVELWIKCYILWKIHGKLLAKITSSMGCVLMQSAMADNTKITRRSKANKCGSHRTGWTGSWAILSLINCDSGFGPFWKLKRNHSCKHSQMRFAYRPSVRNPNTIHTIPVKREMLPQQCF